jgi:hypothetical protein
MTELKPCPFCGGEAMIKQDIRYPRYGEHAGKAITAYEPICVNTNCIMYNQDGNYFTTKEEAVRAWNNRLDVQETKHGKWLINCDGYYPYCSECGNEPQGRAMTDYCPNCGAKMDGGLKND